MVPTPAQVAKVQAELEMSVSFDGVKTLFERAKREGREPTVTGRLADCVVDALGDLIPLLEAEIARMAPVEAGRRAAQQAEWNAEDAAEASRVAA